MPFGGPPLPSATIAVIRQWISDGALHTATATRTNAFAVTSVTPAPGDVVLETPARIIVGLNRELDLTRLDVNSVRLERLATDDGEATTVAVPVDLSVPGGNSFALMVTPRQLLVNGRYRLVVSPPPASGLSDIGGERLRSATPDGAISVFSVEANP
jgi:hypothetical protein